MKIETSRLILSEIKEDDIADIHEMHCFFEVSKFNTIGIPKSMEETRKVLEKAFSDQANEERTSYTWVIREKGTGAFVGEIGMNVYPQKYSRAEIFYNLHPDQWGRGYATEAALGILKFGFEELKLHRIEAGVAVENERSIHLLEKIGMIREGRHRKILPIRGGWYDNFHYAILEEDFFSVE